MIEEVQTIQAAAGPAGASTLEALSVANKWIIDTGCGKDLVGYKYAMRFQELIEEGEPFAFNTANGSVPARQILPINVAEFADDGAHTAQPYLMHNSPNVLSVGLRCNNGGYSHIWLRGLTPCLITPALKISPLDVSGDIPYLEKDGLHSQGLSQEEVTALTGVMIDEDGHLMVDPDFLKTYVCAAADGGEPADPAGEPSSGAHKQKDARGKKEGDGGIGADSGADGESTEAPETGDEISEFDSDPEEANAQVVRQSLKARAASLQHKPTSQLLPNIAMYA